MLNFLFCKLNCLCPQVMEVPEISHHDDEADSLQTDGLVAMVTDDTVKSKGL